MPSGNSGNVYFKALPIFWWFNRINFGFVYLFVCLPVCLFVCSFSASVAGCTLYLCMMYSMNRVGEISPFGRNLLMQKIAQ
jgi:hypothetical protein